MLWGQDRHEGRAGLPDADLDVEAETASRLRGRIDRVLNAAKAERLRAGENPAAWRRHLDATLPQPNSSSRRHHAALPYLELPAFMDELRQRMGVAARALEFLILTATRTSEALNATWDEFDLEAEVWTIPAARMKARVVPARHRGWRAGSCATVSDLTAASGGPGRCEAH